MTYSAGTAGHTRTRNLIEFVNARALIEAALRPQKGDIFYLPNGEEVEFLRHVPAYRGGALDGAPRACVRKLPDPKYPEWLQAEGDLKYIVIDDLLKFPPGIDPDTA